MKEIVVGVDGSRSAQEALHAAVRLAKLEGAKLRAVTAWHVPALAYGGMGGFPLGDMRATFAEDARQILDEGLAAIADERDGMAIEEVVEEGRAPTVLLEAAKDADLLIVGCRGRGGFGGLLLGSVSQECIQHAHCAVLVVHEHEAVESNGARAAPAAA